MSAPTSAPTLMPTSAPTLVPTRAPTLIPTVPPTVSLVNIQLEGDAMADIARAIPGLTTLSGMERFYVHIVCLTHSLPCLRPLHY